VTMPRESPIIFNETVVAGKILLPVQPLADFDRHGRLLLFESPTPRARTYADRLPENSREVTLVAEAALRGYIR
jgi:hypothetical protein